MKNLIWFWSKLSSQTSAGSTSMNIIRQWTLLSSFVLAILRLFQAGLSSPVVVTRHHQARVIRKTINVSYDVTGSRLSKLYSLCYLGILLQRSLLQIANVFSRRKGIFFASYLDDFKRSLESKGQKVLFSLSISLLDLSFWERLPMPASCRCSWEAKWLKNFHTWEVIFE